VKDLRAYHAQPNVARRAEIEERKLDALQEFLEPRDKKLRLCDVIAMFDKMKV
jgi:hypothetical protein